MTNGRKFLTFGALSALGSANAARSFSKEGPASVLSFASGLPTSEMPMQTLGFQAGVAALAVAKGKHKTTAGKVALGLLAASAAGLVKIRQKHGEAEGIVEKALTDELGASYRDRRADPFLAPRSGVLPQLLPSPKWRQVYERDGHLSYGDAGRRNTVHVWRRDDLPADANAPVIVNVHGGGWVTGDKEGQAYPLMAHLAERGWVCVQITYRLSPRAAWPAHIVDVKKAIAWVKDNIADYGGDPDWVAITGGSAGGHLCSLAALTPNDPQFQPGFEDADTSVRAAVPFYGVYDWTNRDGSGRTDIEDFLAKQVLKISRSDDPDRWEQASPMTHIRHDAVPMFFLHGSEDSLVPVAQARAMVDLLRKESQQPVVYAEFDGAQHAFDVFGSERTLATVDAVERFLDVCRAEF